MRTINNETGDDNIRSLIKMPTNVDSQMENTFYSHCIKMKVVLVFISDKSLYLRNQISSDMEMNSYTHHINSELDSLDINFPHQFDNCTKLSGKICLLILLFCLF